MKRTVVSMLQEASRNYTNETFVAKKGENGWWHKTFMEVLRDSRAFAASLVKKGIQKNETIAILAEGSPDWVTGEFGTILAGGISVPLSIKLQPEEITYRINHSEAHYIIVSKNMLYKIEAAAGSFTRSLGVFVIDEDGSSLEELQEKSKTLSTSLFLFRNLLLEGYRVLEDVQSDLDRIEDKIQENDVVTISYTSGTTGNPKGIMLTHLNYWTNCHDSVEMFEVPPKEYSTLVILPCDHSFAHSVGIYSALLKGITLYFVDARGGGMAMLRNIPVNLKETDPVFLLTVPSLSGNFMKKIKSGVNEKSTTIQKIFNRGIEAGIQYYGNGYNKSVEKRGFSTFFRYTLAEKTVFPRIRKIFGKKIQFCVGGGALLDTKQQEFFNAIGVPIYQGYGLTEAAPVISSNLPKKHKFGTSGVLAPSVECKIVDESSKELPAGTRGEIIIRGDNVMKGYFKNPQATQETIRDRWLYTGDLGYFDKDGFLVVVGRKKALLISSDGEKYSPEGIEEAIINSSELISQVLLYNDHNVYTSALLVPEVEKVREYVETQGIQNPKEVIQLLYDEMNAFQHNKNYAELFPGLWLPVTYQLITVPFSEENKMINSSMKMVRYKVIETYRERIEYMYSEEGKQCYNPKNIEAVKELFPDLLEQH